jgi:hypothetical protein
MERTAINPVSWSVSLGFDQAELIEENQRLLVCSGQDAVDAEGNAQHPGEMGAQLEMSLDNLEAVLDAADMTLATQRVHDRLRRDGQALGPCYGPIRKLRWWLCDYPARRHAPIHTAAPCLAGGNRG